MRIAVFERRFLKLFLASVRANIILLDAISSAVVVLPHHLGPSISTAPFAFKQAIHYSMSVTIHKSDYLEPQR